MHAVQTIATISPLMFVEPLTKEHFSKGSQWLTLTRASAYVLVHDRIVEPWLATFGGSRWRCRFISEARELAPYLPSLIKLDGRIGWGESIVQLQRHNALPLGFSQGEVYSESVPPAQQQRRQVLGSRLVLVSAGQAGMPHWAVAAARALVDTLRGTQWRARMSPAQAEAHHEYRSLLDLQKPPTWALLPPKTAPRLRTLLPLADAARAHTERSDVRLRSHLRTLNSAPESDAADAQRGGSLASGTGARLHPCSHACAHARFAHNAMS
jgi:hypothetical protein